MKDNTYDIIGRLLISIFVTWLNINVIFHVCGYVGNYVLPYIYVAVCTTAFHIKIVSTIWEDYMHE